MAEAAGLPLVVTEHDLTEIDACRLLPRRWKHYERVYARAAAVVVTSGTMARLLRDIFPAVFTRVPIHVLHNGVLTSRPAGRRARGHSDDNGRPVRILSVGGMYPSKQYPLLVRAFGKVARRHPRARLDIVGDGADRPKVEAEIRRLDVGSRVRLLGTRSNAYVRSRMRRADVFALPAVAEAFGNVYLEAMAEGLPVACTSDCGFAEVVEHGRTAVVVPPLDEQATADALNQLVADHQVRQRLAHAGRRLVERDHTWDAHGRRLHAVLHDAARPPARLHA